MPKTDAHLATLKRVPAPDIVRTQQDGAHASPPRRRPKLAEEVANSPAWAVRLGDLVSMTAAGFLAYALRHSNMELPSAYWAAIALGLLLQQAVAGTLSIDRVARPAPTPSLLANLLLCMGVTFLMLGAVAYAAKISDQFSRLWTVLWFAGTLAGMAGWRFALGWGVRRSVAARRLHKRIVVVGSPQSAARFIARLDGAAFVVATLGMDGAGDGLAERCMALRADEVVIVSPMAEAPDPGRLVQALRAVPVCVRYCLEPALENIVVAQTGLLAGSAAVQLFSPPLSGTAAFVKRAEDILIGGLLLALALPGMLLIALAIKADSPGPVIFRQKRLGFRGETFTVYKFRTMVATAGTDPLAPQAVARDPRVTRVGSFLRRWGLDELPQIVNVLRGEMSLVGPRPHALTHDAHFATVVDNYAQRRKMRPGITGWAQVHGLRGEVRAVSSLERRALYDVEYIENWSLGFDLWILLLTPLCLLRSSGSA